MDLLLEQSIAQVEQALLDTITLALRSRASVADLDALRARSTRGAGGGPARSDRDLVYVASVDSVYGWVQASTPADDGDATIRSIDGGATGLFIATFAPGSDTYRDLLPTGEWLFAAVATGDVPPDVASGALRIGVTMTDAYGVVTDRFIASASALYADPDQVALSQ